MDFNYFNHTNYNSGSTQFAESINSSSLIQQKTTNNMSLAPSHSSDMLYNNSQYYTNSQPYIQYPEANTYNSVQPFYYFFSENQIPNYTQNELDINYLQNNFSNIQENNFTNIQENNFTKIQENNQNTFLNYNNNNNNQTNFYIQNEHIQSTSKNLQLQPLTDNHITIKEYPKYMIQNSLGKFKLHISLLNGFVGNYHRSSLSVVAVCLQSEKFQIEGASSNIPADGNIMMNLKIIKNNIENSEKEVQIVFKLINLQNVQQIGVSLMVTINFLSNTKNLPYPSITDVQTNVLSDSFVESHELVNIRIEADRLKKGRTNFMTLFVLDQSNYIRYIVNQEKIKCENKTSAYFQLPVHFLNTHHKILIRYISEQGKRNTIKIQNINEEWASDDSGYICI